MKIPGIRILLLSRQPIGRTSWLIGTLALGALQVMLFGLFRVPNGRHHPVIFGAYLSFQLAMVVATSGSSFLLTVRRLRALRLSGWLAWGLLLYLCPLLSLVGFGVMVFFDVTIARYVLPLEAVTLSGILVLAIARDRR